MVAAFATYSNLFTRSPAVAAETIVLKTATTHRERFLSMSNWSPTSPLFTRQPLPRNPQDVLADLDDWSIAELLLGERFEQPTPDAPLAPTPSAGARAEPATASQPAWLANAQWHATPGTVSWPERPAIPRSAISDDPFERVVIGRRRPTPRQSPMGPPFLNQPPSDYPSHLGPVPRARIGSRWHLAPYRGHPWRSRRVRRTGARPSPASNAAARTTAVSRIASRPEGGDLVCRPMACPRTSVRANRTIITTAGRWAVGISTQLVLCKG